MPHSRQPFGHLRNPMQNSPLCTVMTRLPTDEANAHSNWIGGSFLMPLWVPRLSRWQRE